jgi:phage shock protein PspC (stress-responsive transcriptional regulator)
LPLYGRLHYREDNHDTHSYSGAEKQKNYTEILKRNDHGVSAGLGHYFGIDAVWVRILFILLVWGAGQESLYYLWIVVPAAVTTSEKLEMTGEPVNISNIEKKVRKNLKMFLTNLKC